MEGRDNNAAQSRAIRVAKEIDRTTIHGTCILAGSLLLAALFSSCRALLSVDRVNMLASVMLII